MNHRTISQDVKALLSQPRVRAVLVTEEDGSLSAKPVEYGQSVVALERDLIDHLSARPIAPEYLAELRDYCTARLDAAAVASRAGGFIVPGERAWHITHAPLPGRAS